MTRPTIQRNGRRFVLVEPLELRRLERLAAKAAAKELPPLPAADAQGNRPAVAFARASIARSIVQERQALGITQEELARLSGLRQETISRLEAGKHSPTVRTVERLAEALERERKRRAKKSRRRVM